MIVKQLQQYENLKKEIRQHDYHYYVECKPIISDYKYDHLLKELEAIEAAYPEFITPDSPTQRVGGKVSSGFVQVAHEVPMLSLANTYSLEEVEEFVARVHKLLEKRDLKFYSELKMDGIAVSLRYEKGKFVRALTRGSGKKGEDISVNVKTIRTVPLVLEGDDYPDVLEVRGEVFMLKAIFNKLNEESLKEGRQIWANPRNAAGGSLKLLDPSLVAKRQLSIICYGIAEGTVAVSTQMEVHNCLKKWGFPVLDQSLMASCASSRDVLEYGNRIEKLRHDLPFEIDGIVVKVDDLSLHPKLGMTGKCPRWAVAYKFAAEQAESTILDITVQVGRTGILTPVAELQPTELAGSLISRATLHNQDEVDRKDIRIGDRVIIEKGGFVIPKVVEVVHSKRPHGTKKWVMPTICPGCGSPVKRQEGEVAYRCSTPEQCVAARHRRIAFFASKKAMDIDHLGTKVVGELMDVGVISSIPDLYTLTADDLEGVEGFKEKSIQNLIRSIENSKTPTLARFIFAIGIPFVGEGTAEVLANDSGDIFALMEKTEQQLAELDGVGDKMAASIVQFFKNSDHVHEIKTLLSLGVIPQKPIISQKHSPFFKGKTFVLTGSLEGFTRDEASRLIKERGGKTSSAVSETTDYLLAGESAGSKYAKAQKLGIPILNEQTFKTHLAD